MRRCRLKLKSAENCTPLLWERACSRWYRLGVSDRPRRLHREQARSHNSSASLSQPAPAPTSL
ncbi:hypothetical protein C7A07_21030 [Pseudomonas fragi]|nr:hypothetical protein C7A07_21030 [Pseudomonas fragi]